jgi:hypothetical protein
MNCQSFENIIDDLAREQLIDARLREDALQHTDECAECAARLIAEQSLTLSLRALALEMDSVTAPAHLQDYLLTKFNQLQVSGQVRRPRRWNYLSTAAAAVLLVALGIGVAAWNLRIPFKGQIKTPVTSEAVVANAKPVTSANIEASQPSRTPDVLAPTVNVRRPKIARPRRLSARPKVAPAENVAALSETEVATDFMPLAYVNSASLQDSASVVRVELPRSTIVSLGFAVNMDRYGERVKADVLMGADGLARAIRFVQ